MDVYGYPTNTRFENAMNNLKNLNDKLAANSLGGANRRGGLEWPDEGVWVAQLLSSGVVVLLLVAAFFCCGMPLLRRSVVKQLQTRVTVACGPPTAGYAPLTVGYAPPTVGYAPPTAGYAPPTVGYAPPTVGYASPKTVGCEPV